MVIDFHTHTFPEKIAHAAIDKLERSALISAFSSGTAGGLFGSMKKSGVDLSVVLPVATNPKKVVSINDLSIRNAEMEGLVWFGSMHPDADDACGELERIADAGIKGIKLHPVYQHTDIDDPRYVRILSRAGELGLIVVMHAGEDIGFPGEVRCSPEMTRRALLQAGPVKLVCAHMGGWRNWDRVADCLGDTGAMIDTSFSLGMITPRTEGDYTPQERQLMDAEAFCSLVRAFGAQRVLFGTDSPWTPQEESLAAIRALPLDEEEKRLILGENARRLLGIQA